MGIRSMLSIILLLVFTYFVGELNPMKVYRLSIWLWPLAVACLPVLNMLARSSQAGIGSFPFDLLLFVLFSAWSAGNIV